ncbi:MAG TPA: hypothetical protein VFT29_06615 [Gemmatimonadaceae bacterium]|nr:hypothetical protein [Gemmatimonadaceae bacterium]
MTIRRRCTERNCKNGRKCLEHLRFDVMLRGKRYRIPANELAISARTAGGKGAGPGNWKFGYGGPHPAEFGVLVDRSVALRFRATSITQPLDAIDDILSSVAELTHALKQIDKIPNAWVRLGLVVPDGRNLGLLFNILKGKRGPTVQHCRVRCIRVRQWHVDDLDVPGGGIRLYGADHPLARQYSSGKARVRLKRVEDAGAAIAALVTAHGRIFDDWVPIDRYLGSVADLPVRVAKGLSLTGPEFVLKGYARSLHSVAAASLIRRSKRSSTARFRVLHFSQSFVVAERFEADLISDVELTR